MLFFFNDTATTEIYTLSLHDALPRSPREPLCPLLSQDPWDFWRWHPSSGPTNPPSTRRRFRKGPERPAAWRPLDTFQRASVYLPPPTGRNSPGIRLAPGCPTDSARLPDPRARHTPTPLRWADGLLPRRSRRPPQTSPPQLPAGADSEVAVANFRVRRAFRICRPARTSVPHSLRRR